MIGSGSGGAGHVPKGADFDKIHPWFTWVRQYLGDCAGERKLAGRKDIDPGCFGSNLHLLNLADVVRDGDTMRFRYRLVGSTQSQMAGREITGRFVEEAVLPRFVDRINANMRAVVETGGPIYDRFPMPHPERDFIDSERVYFPLAADGDVVDMILIASSYPGIREMMPRMPAGWKSGSA
ncbi:MAG: PAS domain-containing protein [Proteobacteria bacterium]|nr:PAS domain-containing protein [Pseudomonadota bacterium]